MARAIWTGSLSFGLVSIPVGLYSATEDKAIRFHQFQEGTTDRIRNKRVNERTGEEVDYADIVKGYDIGGGEYVIVKPEELEAVEPGATRTIEIVDFVDLEAIDPIYYKTDLLPRPPGSRRPTGLRAAPPVHGTVEEDRHRHLRHAFQAAPRGRPPRPRCLALETMFFSDEVRDPAREIGSLPGDLDLQAPRDRYGQAAHRLDVGRMESRQLRRHLPRAGRRTDRSQAPG